MKHNPITAALIAALIDEHLAAIGSPLQAYFDLLTVWNRSIRLTGSTDRADLNRHALEAMTLLPHLPNDCAVIDIGSGGGFPAIPVALSRSDLHLTLVEPVAKKVAFLRTAKRELSLNNVEVIRGRDEDVHKRFDRAMSQATFSPPEWLERGQRLVHPDGLVLALLGPNPGELPPTTTIHPTFFEATSLHRQVATLAPT